MRESSAGVQGLKRPVRISILCRRTEPWIRILEAEHRKAKGRDDAASRNKATARGRRASDRGRPAGTRPRNAPDTSNTTVAQSNQRLQAGGTFLEGTGPRTRSTARHTPGEGAVLRRKRRNQRDAPQWRERSRPAGSIGSRRVTTTSRAATVEELPDEFAVQKLPQRNRHGQKLDTSTRTTPPAADVAHLLSPATREHRIEQHLVVERPAHVNSGTGRSPPDSGAAGKRSTAAPIRQRRGRR